MKATILALSGFTLCATTLWAAEKGAAKLVNNGRSEAGRQEIRTLSSFDRPDGKADKDPLPRGTLKFVDADLSVVLNIYQEVSGRTVIRPSNLPAVKITVENETPLTRVEVLQTLDTVLAANQIAMVLMGTKFVKAVPAAQAVTESGPVIELPPDQLPESGSYLVYIVRPKNRAPIELIAFLQPFAKLQSSIVAIKDPPLLILRDYSVNVRRMLQLLERIEKEDRAQ